MTMILTAILKYFAMTAISVLVAVVTFYVQKLGRAIFAKLETTVNQEDFAYMTKIIESAKEDIGLAIETVHQTYVKELKEAGKFDQAAQEEALNKAIAITKKELLNKEQKKMIETAYPSLDGFIKTVIESYLSH